MDTTPNLILSGQPIVEVADLTHAYGGQTVLHSLNFIVPRGEIFGFLGHNGAGKTTTISILTTLLRQSAGTARVAGFDTIKEPNEVRKRIGYLPENVTFYDDLTAYENLAYFARLSGVADVDERIDETLGFLDFRGVEHRKLKTFSKGMRQRIGLAQAILHQPQVLFLDEPTSGLDPVGIKNLRDVILRLNREQGITIFMNTHLLSEVAKTCTSIGVLNRGRLIYNESLEKTLADFPDEMSLETIYVRMEEAV
ncbi:MAG: ABC transporter ATP-binding protein [Patescibacteria group bacterium]|nr:ABC transporter ATP-binding protein [Patescibacteria group bacterium]